MLLTINTISAVEFASFDWSH